MRISSSVVLSGLLAVAVQAVPQGSATSSASATATAATSAPTPTVSPTPEQICLGKCNPGDVDCQAACIVVPAPNQSVSLPAIRLDVSNTISQMANDTHDCAAKCNQGSGSPADTAQFAACVQGCITSHFFSAGNATPAPGTASGTAGSGTATATGMIFRCTPFYHITNNTQATERQPEPQLLTLDPRMDPPPPQVPPRLLVLLTACKSVPRSLASLVSWQLSLPCRWDRVGSISSRRGGI
jgi:hypothetical protein